MFRSIDSNVTGVDMTNIVNTIQAIVRDEIRGLRATELGIVKKVYPHGTDSDTDNYACDVEIKNSQLLLKRVPISTDRIGTVAIPNLNDLVLLAFVKGDVNQPIVIGRLYNDQDRPPLNNNDEVIFRLPLDDSDDKTLKAAIRNLQQTSEPREIIIEMDPKITVRITDGTIRATAGKSEMTIDQSNTSGGTVTVLTGSTKMTMNQDGDIQVEAAGSIALKANRDFSVDAMSISMKSQLDTTIEAGTQLNAKGGVTAKLEGGANTTVQGTVVSVKGTTLFSP
jgi:phage baseplate assembly protein gpV